jgi:hypothetical protein
MDACRRCSHYLASKGRHCEARVSCRRKGCARYCWQHARLVGGGYSRVGGCTPQAPEVVVLLLAHEGVWHPQAWHAWKAAHSRPEAVQFVAHVERSKQGDAAFDARVATHQRVTTTWCSREMVQAILGMVGEALALWPDAKRFAVVPGDALPIASVATLLGLAREGGCIMNHTVGPEKIGDLPLVAHNLEMVLDNASARALVAQLLPLYSEHGAHPLFAGAPEDHCPDEYAIGTFLRSLDPFAFDTKTTRHMLCLWFADPGASGDAPIHALTFDAQGAQHAGAGGSLVAPDYSDPSQFIEVENGLDTLNVLRLLRNTPLSYTEEAGYGEGGHAEDGEGGHAEDGEGGHAEDGEGGHAEDGENGHAEDGEGGHAEDGQGWWFGERSANYTEGYVFFRKVTPGALVRWGGVL